MMNKYPSEPKESRKAIVRIPHSVLVALLQLPPGVAIKGIQPSPERDECWDFKLEGKQLYTVPEGGLIPEVQAAVSTWHPPKQVNYVDWYLPNTNEATDANQV